MGESTRAVCILLTLVGFTIAFIVWTEDRPDATTWALRFGSPIVALLALGLIVKLHFRADLEPDYLRTVAGTYFNRDGFCFALCVTSVDGIAFMHAHFQTQYDQPCVGRIAVRPARGFFMNRANIDAITFEVEVPPAGFGCAQIAIPLPKELQGKTQSFEVGASVNYLAGKGSRIRFHDGIFLRRNTNFGDSFATALTIAGAATGSIVLSSPATVTVSLPTGVSEELPPGLKSETKVLWQKGDAPLMNVVRH